MENAHGSNTVPNVSDIKIYFKMCTLEVKNVHYNNDFTAL